MVSQQRRRAARPAPADSRTRILEAAGAEFAARGFDGAKVDRIAARARVNKAMIYYHFKNKSALYREILVGVFRSIADAVTGNVRNGTPESQLLQFIGTIAHQATTHPRFAAMWMREMADGGTHIDRAIVTELRRVLAALGGIIEEGRAAGTFRAAHPLVTQLGIVAPILFFAASQPARERLARQGLTLATPDADVLLRHIETAALGALRGKSAS